MEQHQRRRRAALVMRVRHEPSRVAAACLADAYERVVPVVRRGNGRLEAPAGAAATAPSYRQGGITG